MKCTLVVFALTLSVLSPLQVKAQSNGINNNYTAAVVEYSGVNSEQTNVKNLISIIRTIKGADIIVLPESSVSPMVNVHDVQTYPTLSDSSIGDSPCMKRSSYPDYFADLSCAARDAYAYLTVNIVSKEPCQSKTPCALWGFNLYNTDVIFDRKGSIVARYRKFHLFGEILKNTTKVADHVMVTTDFGVTFGIFTCFDIMFDSPALELVDRGLRNIIYPTDWFSELPFLTALQTQQMWAQENNVTLIAAGFNNARLGSGGSGIYEGEKGPLIFNITTDASSRVYKASIPSIHPVIPVTVIDRQAEEMDEFFMLTENMTGFKSVVLKTEPGRTYQKVCDGEGEFKLCCQFDVRISIDHSEMVAWKNRYTYHMVARSAVRTFHGMADGGEEICGVIACLNNTVTSCGRRFPKYDNITWPVSFDYIQISANYTDVKTKRQFPNSLLASIRPINPAFTKWEKRYLSNRLIERSHTLMAPTGRLLTFSIYGRDYKRDHVSSSSGAFRVNINILAIPIFVLFVKNTSS